MLQAKDFKFCVSKDEDQDCLIVLISHPDEHMQDQEIGHIIRPWWPVDMELDEVTESTFAVLEDMDEEQVKQAFIDAGFTFDQKFQDEVDAGFEE